MSFYSDWYDGYEPEDFEDPFEDKLISISLNPKRYKIVDLQLFMRNHDRYLLGFSSDTVKNVENCLNEKIVHDMPKLD